MRDSGLRETQGNTWLFSNFVFVLVLHKVFVLFDRSVRICSNLKPMDGGAWWAAVHGVTRVGHDFTFTFTFTFHFHALEREMATHSSVLAWRIPGTGEPGGVAPSQT